MILQRTVRTLAALLVLLATSVAGCEKVVTYEPPPEKRAIDSENQAMTDAKALAAKNDLEGAHAKLAQISQGSPLSSTPEFQDIENRWAKDQIAKADAEKDKTKKLALLDTVSRSTTVSGELRAQASTKAAEATPDPAIPPPVYTWDPALARANLAKVREVLTKNQIKAAIGLLEPRVFAGIGSPEENSLLASLCAQEKDKACLATMSDAGILAPSASQVVDRSPPRKPPPKK